MKASLLATSLAAFALSVSAGEWKFPCPENEIESYTAYHIRQPVKVDGKLDEPFWRLAPTSPRFKDIITGGPTLHDTRVTVVWDDENLYLGYRVEEPFVRATLTKHNAPVWQENDVEFFVAGRDSYFEFEINALNTTYEMLFIWEDAYESGGFGAAPEFARGAAKPDLRPCALLLARESNEEVEYAPAAFIDAAPPNVKFPHYLLLDEFVGDSNKDN